MLSGTDYPLMGVGRRVRNMAGLHVRTGLVVLLLTLSEGKSPINISSIDAVAINVARVKIIAIVRAKAVNTGSSVQSSPRRSEERFHTRTERQL